MSAKIMIGVLWPFVVLLVLFIFLVVASVDSERRTTAALAPENTHTSHDADPVKEIPVKYAHIIETIENPDHEVGQLLKQLKSQQSSAVEGDDRPGELSPQYENFYLLTVDDLDAFMGAYLLFKTDQKRKRLEEESKTRLQYLEQRGIEPGGGYDIGEYTKYFNYVLDTMEVQAELGNTKKAVELSNEALRLSEISGSEGQPTETLVVKLGLRSEAQWRIGSALGHDAFLLESLSTCEQARGMAADTANNDLVLGLDHFIAKRRYDLVECGLMLASELEVVRNTLARIERKGKSTVSSLTIYIKTLRKLGRFSEAREALRRLAKLCETEGRTVSSLTMADAAQILILNRLDSAESFRDAFGPFAPSLFAECHEICLDEAWEKVLNEAFAGSVETFLGGEGVLFGDFIISESLQGPYAVASRGDIAVHEYEHRRVQSGHFIRSGGQWLRVRRDVPTAALQTYMALITRVQNEDVLLPPSLAFFVNHGQQSARSEPNRIHEYIGAMLEYFDYHGLETNAAYECAAILAGALLEIVGKPDSEEMTSYISHLKLVSHKEALLRAREGIQVRF